ncbi:MAG: hypothetical protein WCV50_05605 [Patescibacteria group bacterium]|jgi:hypothetical protein
MNPQEYINKFTEKLNTGGLKRQEIIEELKNHISDSAETENLEKNIGNPETLARTYDRTHLGWLYSRKRILLIPILLGIFFMLMQKIAPNLNSVDYYWNPSGMAFTNPDLFYFYNLIRDIFILIPLTAAALIGQTAARMHKIQTTLLLAIAITFITCATLNLLQNIPRYIKFLSTPNIVIGTLYYEVLFQAVFTTVLLSITAFCTMAFSGWKSSLKTQFTRGKFYFQTLVLIVASIILFFVISLITEMILVPYDLTMPEMRPAVGTFARELNDFFEGGIGAVLPSIVVIVLLWYSFIKQSYNKIKEANQLNRAQAITFFIILSAAAYAFIFNLQLKEYSSFAFPLAALGVTLSYLKPRFWFVWGILLGLLVPILDQIKNFLVHSPTDFIHSGKMLIPALLGSLIGFLVVNLKYSSSNNTPRQHVEHNKRIISN